MSVKEDLEYWRQFQREAWVLVGFTEQFSATYRNLETGEHIQLTPGIVDMLVDWEEVEE